MARFILRVDDVGRRPGDTPENGTDRDLTFFAEFYKALGLSCKPAVYAAVPTWIDLERLNSILDDCAVADIAVHGWDHHRGIVSREHMKKARDRFQTSCYVPPFNSYHHADLKAWRDAGGRYFFGGFIGEHHLRGHMPTFDGGIVHLPACRQLYGRAAELLPRLEKYERCNAPLVVTLHAPWETNNDHLAAFGNAIRDSLIDVTYVDQWLKDTTLNRGKLTGPHWMAYSWVLDQIEKLPLMSRVLDFGSRYSILPSQISLRGHDVLATDRDEHVREHQYRFMCQYGTHFNVLAMRDVRELRTDKSFDAVTATWAIQHQPSIDECLTVASKLIDMVAVGGHLFVVGSFTAGESFHQTNRQDPQLVLNEAEYRRMLAIGSRTELVDNAYFLYEHGTTKADYCDPKEANAACFAVRRVA